MPEKSGPLIRRVQERTKQLAGDAMLTEPKYRFSDIVLSEEAKAALKELLSLQKNKKLIFDQWGLGAVFPDRKSFTVNLYGRSDLYRLIRSDNPFVVTWNEEPANLEGLKFVTDAKSKKMGLRLVPDTKMVPGAEGQVVQKGLRLVYLGGSALFFR